MLKKTDKKILILISIVAMVVGYCYADTRIVKTLRWPTSYMPIESEEALENYSDVVVLAEATDKTGEVSFMGFGGFERGYTLRTMHVKQILMANGELNLPNVIEVIEPYRLADNGVLPGKVLICEDSYTPMKAGNIYVLYLSWSETAKAWQAGYMRCYDVVEDDDLKGKHGNHLDNYLAQLKTQVKKKYEKEIAKYTRKGN